MFLFLHLLFLLNVRIKVPIGQTSYIPFLEGKPLKNELSKNKRSIVFFSDPTSTLDFADFAIHEYKEQIKFIRSSISEGRTNYQCPDFSPCIRAFEKSKIIHIEIPTILQAPQFLLWVKNSLTPGIINVSTPGHLHQLLIKHDPLIFEIVDQKKLLSKKTFERRKIIPENLTLYLTTQSIFKDINVTVENGYYLFRPADHELLPLTEKQIRSNVIEQLLLPSASSNVLDINECNISQKAFLAGYMINETNSYSSEVELKILKHLASKYSDQMHFTTLYGKPSELYKKASDLLTLPTPYFFIFNTSDIQGGRWLIYKDKVDDIEYVDNFVKRVLADEEYFTVISEDIPSYPGYQTEPFKKIVADNFDDLVISNDNDVFVAFTAPWCPHCTNLKPILNETAYLLKDTKAKVYYIDGSKNDIPECVPSIEGYPTLYFWPAGKKDEAPIKYGGIKRFKDILNFINKTSTNPIEIPPYNEDEIKERIKLIQNPPKPKVEEDKKTDTELNNQDDQEVIYVDETDENVENGDIEN
ncbi:hypothetical protein M9Y10_021920 [Tritrichomonas musculus]|uniref:protein disulfide-isomerase n=1 Tax=Tritrichomonas musculus TaxID=1915356 RepID=A0ABR2KQS5_9EUKA